MSYSIYLGIWNCDDREHRCVTRIIPFIIIRLVDKYSKIIRVFNIGSWNINVSWHVWMLS